MNILVAQERVREIIGGHICDKDLAYLVRQVRRFENPEEYLEILRQRVKDSNRFNALFTEEEKREDRWRFSVLDDRILKGHQELEAATNEYKQLLNDEHNVANGL